MFKYRGRLHSEAEIGRCLSLTIWNNALENLSGYKGRGTSDM